MKVGYGYRRDEKALREAGAEIVYVDTKPTRTKRNDLLEKEGVRRGDELVLLAYLDLGGTRKASDRIAAELERRGVKIAVAKLPEAPKIATGRPPKFRPNTDQDARIREIWLNPIYTQVYKMHRIADIMGEPVKPTRLYYRYGSAENPKDGGQTGDA